MKYVERTADPTDLQPVMKVSVRAPESFDAEAGTMTVALTSEHLDRYDEVVLVDGARLDDYAGVVLYDHGHDALRGRLPVGKIGNLREGDLDGTKALLGDVEFYKPSGDVVDNFPEQLADMYAQGFMTGVSIGFRPLAAETRKADEDAPEVLHYTEWELLELSLVAIPANPKATVLDAPTVDDLDDILPPAEAKTVGDEPDEEPGKEPCISAEPRDIITLILANRNNSKPEETNG